jgi:hypothetical protein
MAVYSSTTEPGAEITLKDTLSAKGEDVFGQVRYLLHIAILRSSIAGVPEHCRKLASRAGQGQA